jgi:acyl dehydratase
MRMKIDAQGATVSEGQEVISEARLTEFAAILGTTSGAETATLVPFFGPTVAGEKKFVEVLGLDLSRAMLAGVNYEWVRPFEAGETVAVNVFIDKVFDKGSNRFGVVVAEFRDQAQQLIQRQSSTFIERTAA